MSSQLQAYTLTEKAEAKGLTVVELITESIQRNGSIQKAAQELDCAPNAIQYQLKKAGLRVNTQTVATVEERQS